MRRTLATMSATSLAFALGAPAIAAPPNLGASCRSPQWGAQLEGRTCVKIGKTRFVWAEVNGNPKPAVSPPTGKTALKNPAALGTTQTLKNAADGNYDVTVESFTPDATTVIANENPFNDVAPSGFRYALLRVTLTYHAGTKKVSSTPFASVSFSAFGASAVERKTTDCGVVIPESLDTLRELQDGGKTTGNLCLLLPDKDRLASLTLRVSESFCFANCDELWTRLQ
jgi:hypothetical protein